MMLIPPLFRFGRIPRGGKGPVRLPFVVFLVSLVSALWPGSGVPADVRTDVFALLAEVRRLESAPLWPGFKPAAIPVALYDYRNTYLFNFPHPPKNFHSLSNRDDVYVFDGQHPAVFGNRLTQLDDTWVATFLLKLDSPVTGKPYSLAEMAGIVIHEKFHVFQALSHPDWRPNDAVLMDYPLDTAVSMTLRTMEIEALRRSVAAERDEASAGWARAAMNIRRQRLGVLTRRHSIYEKELFRFEGIAEYIEYLSSGRPAFDGVPDVGFAPKAVRESGYFEGRWAADVLDRLDPGWKRAMEAGEFGYLEDRLEAVLREGPLPNEFSPDEMRAFLERAAADVLKKENERKERLKMFDARLGTCVEFVSGRIPLRLEMLDPSSMEAVGAGKIIHGRWIVLKNEDGVVEVLDRPCLTELNDEGRIGRLVCPGISRRNPVRLGTGPVSFQLDGVVAYFKSGWVTRKGDFRFIISLR